MGHFESRLKALADDALLAGLSKIARAHQRVTAELLAYLLELDERKLFLDLGFASLFEYCVQALRLCEATAGRHIAAARACRHHADAIGMVARGELHASALSQLNKHLNPENAAELFDACRHQSARQVAELLAARFPRPDVRDSVRRLPVQPNLTPNVESRRLEPLSADRYGVHFTADGEFRDLLERVRGLAGHALPNRDLLTVMKRGLQAYERELEKSRFGIGRKPRATRASTLPAPAPAPAPKPRVRRRQRAALTREIYLRDEKQCTFISPDGRRCTSRFSLQIDHIQPFALSGADTIDNQRLLCRAHNLHHARHCFGRAHVQAVLNRKRFRSALRRSKHLSSSKRNANRSRPYASHRR